jgi:phosphoribosyl 1,2-cyclic phosphodiesterase
MEAIKGISARFWGVRGSIPTPVADNMGFGGNTACLEIRLPSGEILIIDGGTGARPLGAKLMQEAQGEPLSVHFFLTHFHWDHIHGIPFFQPLYALENTVTFYSMKSARDTAEILEGQMAIPYFPVDFKFLPAKRKFVSIMDQEFHFGDTTVTNFALNHPQGCHGYRLQQGNRSLVFASDLEHGEPDFDRILLAAAEGADTLIFDAQFTPEEYPQHRGWGHSTWLEATRVAKQAGVKRLILYHHDPGHSDTKMREILAQARQKFPETSIATEGEEIPV